MVVLAGGAEVKVNEWLEGAARLRGLFVRVSIGGFGGGGIDTYGAGWRLALASCSRCGLTGEARLPVALSSVSLGDQRGCRGWIAYSSEPCFSQGRQMAQEVASSCSGFS